ncbi:hypothetical protein O6H91_11G051100 [Diphasiastrum complanatum]|uniref:Uncharacterized protein n=1 Tax=Diphasiastrum complanatum TaxID=34168 RepID=A0ACC2C913_DIPCM|nr:hypothetical protein O6H91_11G051100 [Diphasiastrum complanatum]
MTPIDDAPSMSFSRLLPFEARKKGKTTDEFEEEEYLKWDPAERLGSDVMQLHIFSNLDARSLAQCSLVCKRWKGLSQVDSLWAPLCFQLWQRRAHLPLRLMHAKYPVGAYEVYSISMADSLQKELLREEMCARIWEIQVKPSCGPYWISLDPSSHGGAPLRRYFHCDGSLTADVNDPIWGGQESCWFIFSITYHVQIVYIILFCMQSHLSSIKFRSSILMHFGPNFPRIDEM